MAKMVKSVSFSREFKKEYEYICSQENPSGEVCKAIRFYIENIGIPQKIQSLEKENAVIGNLLKGLDPE